MSPKESIFKGRNYTAEHNYKMKIAGLHGYRDKRKFSEFCSQWLMMKKPALKDSSFSKYEIIIRKHIIPVFGSCIAENITDKDIDNYTHELLYAQSLSPKTVHDILTVLDALLKFVYKQENITGNISKISRPRIPVKEMRVLTRHEALCLSDYLLENIDDCRFGVLLAMVTGIRIGELCALRWKDISLDEGYLRICSTMQRVGSISAVDNKRTKIVIDSPKSEASNRIIPLTDKTLHLCKLMQTDNPENYVLTGNIDYMEPRCLQYRFRKYTSCCGLNDVHFHTLRHTFATRCLETGFDIKTLSEIMGHANTGITLNRYAHSTMEQKRENIKKLSALGF